MRLHPLLIGTASGLLLAGTAMSALAQGGPVRTELRHFVARVEVIPEDRKDVVITVTHGNNRLPQPTISLRADTVIVDGGLNDRSSSFHFTLFDDGYRGSRNGQAGTVSIPGYGQIDVHDLPIIYVRTPQDVQLASSGTAFGHVGPSLSLKLSSAGVGDWRVDPVAGHTVANSAGSGDIHLATCGDVEINAAGSGDYTVGDIRSLRAAQAGSGDIRVGRIKGPARISLAASGDFSAASVRGDVEISIAGSGDVRIKDGTAPRFRASIAGSGNISFGGVAGDVDASIAGSGDISISRATGHVDKHVMGSGDVNVGR